MEIRKMQETDLEQVVLLEQKCFSLPWTKEGFLSGMSLPDTLFLVAAEENKVIGYGSLYVSYDQAELENIAVDPEMRGHGVASKLLCQMQKYCREHEVRDIFLEVRVSNTAGIALYQSNGFSQVGKRPRFYEKPVEDALVMTWHSDSISQ